MFNIVKRYYDLGLYNKEDVDKFVQAGRLNEAEAQEITGQTKKEE